MPGLQLIYTDSPGSLSATYVVPTQGNFRVSSIVARINGAGAASSFYPCLSVYSQDGKLIGRVRTESIFNVGDTGVVTWSPFLRGRRRGAANTQAGFFRAVQQSGPYIFWPMQEASGLVQDFSGNAFHSTVLSGGPVTYQVQGPYADGFAIRYPTNSDFDRGATGYGPITDGNTWVCWARPTSVPAGSDLYGRAWYHGLSLDFRSNGKISAIREGVAYLADSVASWTLNVWHYLALVFRNSDNHYLLYVNGVFDSDIGSGGLPGAGSAPVSGGSARDGGIGASYTVDVCDCVYWARMLTAQEIADLKVA